ncbi:MAG TPA: carbonic anhydrase [Thermoanaerobaculia bacterium]|jgi:carbonic anhydrase
MKTLPELFANNVAWARRKTANDPLYFTRLVNIQRPEYLWIGCSDSRVPANEIVGLAPGEMFVHRNIANIVVPTDPNAMAVIEFAIEQLGVRHVIVTGHYRCGGVRAALERNATGVTKEWLAPLESLAVEQKPVLDALPTFDERWAKLCELNVIRQVETLQQWKQGRSVMLHGWIYDLADGLLKDLELDVDQPL